MSADDARRWIEAARDPAISSALDAFYDALRLEIEALAPVCVASGKCCHFEAYEHRLFVTGLEAATTAVRLESRPALSALDEPGCPFQVGRLCSVHTIRPFGCRVYYCDPKARDWMEDASERYLRAIRALHEAHDLTYHYGEWRSMLRIVLGVLDDPTSSS
ncbi:MAG: YkgJ family cysteine cluster protein [Phycisphaerales bacterium]|nr:YkgJ family cysteine cluster protein [Phycisphaerales bacterium]